MKMYVLTEAQLKEIFGEDVVSGKDLSQHEALYAESVASFEDMISNRYPEVLMLHNGDLSDLVEEFKKHLGNYDGQDFVHIIEDFIDSKYNF
ncbi:MAG: hypothetical protein ACRC92_20525 [Peptostreptococcaceae bacterium]